MVKKGCCNEHIVYMIAPYFTKQILFPSKNHINKIIPTSRKTYTTKKLLILFSGVIWRNGQVTHRWNAVSGRIRLRILPHLLGESGGSKQMKMTTIFQWHRLERIGVHLLQSWQCLRFSCQHQATSTTALTVIQTRCYDVAGVLLATQ